MALLDFFSNIKNSSSASPRVVGIDIGSSSIKVVELEDRNGTITLTTYGEVQLGPYDGKELGQTVLLGPKEEQAALVDVLRESAVKARSGIFSMPLSSSFVTVMSLEKNNDEDPGPRIRVEARKYIPVPISDVTLDWAEIEVPKNEKKNKQEILLAAIQNEGLERLRTLMRQVNMPNQPSEIECFSAIRGVAEADDEGMAIIDIGAVSSKLYVTKQALLYRMHRVRAGGAICTSRIAKAENISFADAEIKKRRLQQNDPEHREILDLHEDCFGRAFREFKMVIDEFESKHETDVSRIILTGGPVQFPGFLKIVEEALDRQVELANPFTKVAYPAFMEDMVTQIGPTFTVATGAALRSFE